MTQLLKTGREACDKCHNLYIPLPGDKSCTCPSKVVVKKPVPYAVLKAEHEAMYEALGHINEYWNRDRNDRAMHDALWEIIETTEAALALVDGRE